MAGQPVELDRRLGGGVLSRIRGQPGRPPDRQPLHRTGPDPSAERGTVLRTVARLERAVARGGLAGGPRRHRDRVRHRAARPRRARSAHVRARRAGHDRRFLRIVTRRDPRHRLAPADPPRLDLLRRAPPAQLEPGLAARPAIGRGGALDGGRGARPAVPGRAVPALVPHRRPRGRGRRCRARRRADRAQRRARTVLPGPSSTGKRPAAAAAIRRRRRARRRHRPWWRSDPVMRERMRRQG